MKMLAIIIDTAPKDLIVAISATATGIAVLVMKAGVVALGVVITVAEIAPALCGL